MLHVLTHNILPVFSMLALGFLLGRLGKVSRQEAAAVNRVAFLVLQPALIFPLINGLHWEEFRLDALGLYAFAQLLVFLLTFVIATRVFKRETPEAWLLSMATIFVNTLLYVWPISFLIYGAGAVLPITGIVAWDSAFSFAFFIVTTDLLMNREATALQSLKRVASNPVLIAIILGAITNALGIATPEPVLTGMKFAGAAAAPLTLFALGVILSGHAMKPSGTILTVSAIKLLVFPLIVWMLLGLGTRPQEWSDLVLLTSAGPSGAMAFALAMLHGVRTDQIAPVIIWTSVLSLISLAVLA